MIIFMMSNVISYGVVIDILMNLRLLLYYFVIERISKLRQWSLSQRSKKKERNTRAPKKHACEGTDTRDRAPFQRKVLLLCASRLTSRACRSKFLAHACQSKSVAPMTKTISLSVILFFHRLLCSDGTRNGDIFFDFNTELLITSNMCRRHYRKWSYIESWTEARLN